MPDHLADLNKHLARLLRQTMKETDPLEHDKLGAEIWRVLHEQERLRLMRIEKYGAGGEKPSQAQMQLFELEPVISEMTEPAESEHAPAHGSTKKSAKHPGRQELPANLPRVERILPCTLDQRVCKRCGKETVVIGYEESSQLDVERRRTSYWSRNERSGFARLVRISASCQRPAATDHRLASDRIVIKNP